MNPERLVLRVESLPPRPSPVTGHNYSIKPNRPNAYEFKYKITGHKLKRKEGNLSSGPKAEHPDCKARVCDFCISVGSE